MPSWTARWSSATSSRWGGLAIRNWRISHLPKASSRHRAVLLHTAPYPAGYALFAAFPAQTTFADPRPVF
jgi:hypothetical protein